MISRRSFGVLFLELLQDISRRSCHPTLRARDNSESSFHFSLQHQARENLGRLFILVRAVLQVCLEIFCLFNKLGDIASVPLVQSLFDDLFNRLRVYIPPAFLQHERKEDHVESEGNQLQLRTSGPVFEEVRHLEQQEFPNFATRSLPQVFSPEAHLFKGFRGLLLDVSVRLRTLSPVSRRVEVRLLVVRIRISLGIMLFSLVTTLLPLSAFLLIALFILLVTMTAAGFEGLAQGGFFFVGFFSLLTSQRGFLFL